MIFRRRKSKELTQQHLEQSGHRTPELDGFLAKARPNEELTFDARGIARHDLVPHLAPHPLPGDLEATASLLARATVEMSHTDLPADHEAVRSIGLALGARGGGFLMVLVAHRAQYVLDPQWKLKRDEAIRRFMATQGDGQMGMALTAGGPLVRRIEREWDGICGWQK